MKLFIQICFTAFLLGLLVSPYFFSFGTHPTDSRLRLVWRFNQGKTQFCPTENDQSDKPVHMRSLQTCTDKFLDYRLSVHLDGKNVLRKLYIPGGFHRDRPPSISEEIRISQGQHDIKVVFEPFESIDEPIKEDLSLKYTGTFRADLGKIHFVRISPESETLVLQ